MSNEDNLYYLPKTGEDLELMEFAELRMPGYTHKLIIDQNRIKGMTDKAKALLQAVYLILNTERYHYPIYSWRYGVELADLIGKPKDYAMSEAKRRIYEALIQDDRITDVDSWVFSSGHKWVTVSFVVHTIYGDVEAEKEIAA
ncbi:MAG: DUF2634 domain-containing protein [Clostridia bacterium]|nr:DUF2634 domain-containing protein [Clostridia bacterium]